MVGERQTAITEARALLEQHPVYLDTETTGLDDNAEVIEIGIIDDHEEILVDELVRPRGKMDPGSLSVHGLSPEMLASKPTWDKIWPQVEAALKDKLVIGYNIEFDQRVMKRSNRNSWLPWNLSDSNFIDLMALYSRFYGEWDPASLTYRRQSLEQAGINCNLSLQNTHRAVDDCLLTRALLHHIAGSS